MMSWLFGDLAKKQQVYDRLCADSWLEHINKADTVINDMISSTDWGRKRKLEAKKKRTKKEDTELWLMQMKIDSAEVSSAVHSRLAAQFGNRLGLF